MEYRQGSRSIAARRHGLKARTGAVARRYLAQGKLNPATLSAVYFNLLLNASLRRDPVQIKDLQRELADHADYMSKPKNIYWTRDRANLIARMNAYLKNKR